MSCQAGLSYGEKTSTRILDILDVASVRRGMWLVVFAVTAVQEEAGEQQRAGRCQEHVSDNVAVVLHTTRTY